MIITGKPGDTYVIKRLSQSSHCNTAHLHKETTLLIAVVPLYDSVFLYALVLLTFRCSYEYGCKFLHVNSKIIAV